ncbi:MAG: Mov34/MPN/PAD-1 family protein [Halobacteriota archaeon]
MLFRSSSVVGIARDTLEFALNASRDTHPREFMGVLATTSSKKLDVRGRLDEDGDVITDVMVIPGSKSGEVMATIREDMIPTGLGGVGTVHSHPSGSTRPSDEDLRTFSKKGRRHIIVGYPYDERSWTCYDREGDVVDLPVLDVEFEDEPLFDGEDW